MHITYFFFKYIFISWFTKFLLFLIFLKNVYLAVERGKRPESSCDCDCSLQIPLLQKMTSAHAWRFFTLWPFRHCLTALFNALPGYYFVLAESTGVILSLVPSMCRTRLCPLFRISRDTLHPLYWCSFYTTWTVKL